jgi:hypothetical protein
VEYAAAVATETSAATASDVANLAVGASAAEGMMSAAGKVAMLAGRVECTGASASTAGAEGAAGFLQGLAAATATALAALTAANVMKGTAGVRAASPPFLSCLLGLQCREGRGDCIGAAWASLAAFLRLQWGSLVVDFMIQMNSMKWFLDDENEMLGKFNDVDDVWGDVQPPCDVWCVVTWWCYVARGSDDQEVWQKEWKLTRKCHTKYPDSLKQNDWDDKWLFSNKEPSQTRWIHSYSAKFILTSKNSLDDLDEFIYIRPNRIRTGNTWI